MIDKEILTVGLVMAGLYIAAVVTSRKIGQAADAITPTNPNNIFYQGVNSLGEALTGEEDFNLGSYLYDLTHGENQ